MTIKRALEYFMRFPNILRKTLPLLALPLAACTSVQVTPVSRNEQIQHVCIKENSKVQVSDFLQVLEEGLDRHGITSESYLGKKPEHCEYILTYTALRSWDVVPYLSEAEIVIRKEGRRIAAASYHLRGKGGLALTKYGNTRDKIAPVIDQLFARIQSGNADD
jgi:hypothetical protein